MQIPKKKHKKYEKSNNVTLIKLRNTTITNTKDSELDEVWDKKFLKMIIRMFIKEDMNKCLN